MQKKFSDEMIIKAIRREEESRELYTTAAEMVKKPEVKKFFLDLAGQELDHKKTLQKLDLNKLADMQISKLSDPDISMISEVDPLGEDFSVQDALLYAIKREDEAYRFYKECSAMAEDASLKNVFENLATIEMRHKTSLEELYEQKIFQEN